MSCCADPRAGFAHQFGTLSDALSAAIRTDGSGSRLVLSVPDIHCAGCLATIESALSGGGVAARVNLTRRTVTLTAPRLFDPAAAVAALRDLGYTPQPLATEGAARDPRGAELLRAVAVAGFAAMNVMLLSVSVWSGADGSTRAFLNWFSALVALPALAYAARPFFRSAFAALARRRLNMDVPIALGITLASAMSLAKTIADDGEIYFDAAVTLTFLLLVGRLLDHLTRERARASVGRLAQMRVPVAHVVGRDGTVPVPAERVRPGDVVEVAAGERMPLDGRLLSGRALIDAALATGESRPEPRAAGDEIVAGALALTGPHRLEVLRRASDSYVARLEALQAAAETARSRPARIADRAAAIYSPTVHLVAALTIAGWLATGAGLGDAVTAAIAVLIITCPCALGLAVPAVHVAACDRLFRRGLAIKDGAALERLRLVREVVFDKTGTLTVPTLADPDALPADLLAAAAGLARHSTHPVARAVLAAAEARGLPRVVATEVEELRGRGMAGRRAGRRIFLGQGAPPWGGPDAGFAFHSEGEPAVPLAIDERLRPGAKDLVARLRADGLPVTILSGDRPAAVEAVARELGVDAWRAAATPDAKVAFLSGRAALMVGDGLNDGPALAAATASISPAGACDLSRTAADIVMTEPSLAGVWMALDTARRAHRLVLQNFAVAAVYNAVAIPVAVAGYASPLVAAVAMSTSSIVVTLNALRLLR